MRFRELRTYRGMVDMGRFGWPKPRAIVLKDRVTGVQYLLTHDSTSDAIILTTPVPRRARALPEEPILVSPVGRIRLFVSNGSLGQELVAAIANPGVGSVGRADEPLFTLNYADQRTTYELHGEGVTAFPAPLCLRKWSNLGLTTDVTDLGCNLDLGDVVGVVVFEEDVFEEGVFE